MANSSIVALAVVWASDPGDTPAWKRVLTGEPRSGQSQGLTGCWGAHLLGQGQNTVPHGPATPAARWLSPQHKRKGGSARAPSQAGPRRTDMTVLTYRPGSKYVQTDVLDGHGKAPTSHAVSSVVGQVLVVSPDHEQLGGSLQPVSARAL